MDRSFENYLYFGGELFIPIQEAFDYLVDGSVVYQLDQFFFHYKGFADECEFGEGYLDPFCTLLRIVYLDAVAILDDMEGVLHKFKQMSFDGGSLTARWFDPYRGTINGKNELPENCQISYYFRTDITMNNSNVYVRQSDLDEASKKFGIAKNPNWNSSVLKNNSNEEKDYIGDSVNAATTTFISDSPEESVIEFTKSVLIQHPDIKTADLKKYCFDDMNGLNPRDGKIINDLLIKAGAKKSKQGEQAKYIAWESKYPRAQWVRVFNKKN